MPTIALLTLNEHCYDVRLLNQCLTHWVNYTPKYKITIMKSILLKILSIISPVIILITLGIMQAAWFDVEESIERGDTEVYHPSFIQYLLYYLVSIVLFVLSWLLLKHEYKNTSSAFLRIIYATILVLDISIILICFLAL